jgi:hypothetical protein
MSKAAKPRRQQGFPTMAGLYAAQRQAQGILPLAAGTGYVTQ